VTGNFWAFPILKAIATVTLPEGAEILQHAAYTGRVGETGRDYVVPPRGPERSPSRPPASWRRARG
jgi:hypothetical protein